MIRLFGKIFNNKPQTIIVKQEIDYDKLADAIVKAQKKLKEDEEKAERKFSAVYILLQLTAVAFLFIFGIVIFMFCPAIGYAIGIIDATWKEKVAMFVLALVIGMFSLLALASAYEVYITDKKDFINNIFTAIMTFSTLIIAVVSAVIAYKSL